jgi:ABC-type antimicrobial peptide transport system permease subunit
MRIPFKYNFRNLFIRKTTTALTVFGVAMVVLIFVALSSLVYGLSSTITKTGSSDNVVVLGQGSISFSSSLLDRSAVQEVKYLSEVKPSLSGEPLASTELVIEDELYYKQLNQSFPTPVRGVQPIAFEVHDDVKIIRGQPPQANGGIALGQKIAEQMGIAGLGEELEIGPRTWTVVGIFSANGNTLESEIWADFNDLATATRRNKISAIVLKVKDPQTAAAVSSAISENPRMRVKALPETQYYNAQTSDAQRIWTLTIVVSIILSIAAIFGGMNTMYAAITNRIREIGILRALGFSQRSILFSFTAECIFIALIGGAIGCLFALAVNGISIKAMSGGRFLDFSFQLTPAIALKGIVLSLLIGVVGGLFPARRASRMHIIEALRSQ